MPAADLRDYDVTARSTDVFGRVLCSARQHHFVIDGPVQNGCPGEELTPPEAFLAGVAACGVELIQVIGRQSGHEAIHVTAQIHAGLDRANPVRSDVTVFNSVTLALQISGVTHEVAFELAEAFKKR
jgi:organic hydroperoxide reductase OsmC/OhrA